MNAVSFFKAAVLTFLKMEARSFKETVVAYTKVHSVISQKTGKLCYYRCDDPKNKQTLYILMTTVLVPFMMILYHKPCLEQISYSSI